MCNKIAFVWDHVPLTKVCAQGWKDKNWFFSQKVDDLASQVWDWSHFEPAWIIALPFLTGKRSLMNTIVHTFTFWTTTFGDVKKCWSGDDSDIHQSTTNTTRSTTNSNKQNVWIEKG